MNACIHTYIENLANSFSSTYNTHFDIVQVLMIDKI